MNFINNTLKRDTKWSVYRFETLLQRRFWRYRRSYAFTHSSFFYRSLPRLLSSSASGFPHEQCARKRLDAARRPTGVFDRAKDVLCFQRGRRFFVLVSSNNSFEMSRRRKVRSSKISEHGRALFQTAYCQAEKTKIKNFRYRADSNKLKNKKKIVGWRGSCTGCSGIFLW